MALTSSLLGDLTPIHSLYVQGIQAALSCQYLPDLIRKTRKADLSILNHSKARTRVEVA